MSDAHALSRRTPTRQSTGQLGETIAANYLSERGFTILERNWRSPHGELDLIVSRGPLIVAIEVKTRRGTGYGPPLSAITRAKVATLRRLFATWLASEQPNAEQVRIDGIGVTLCDPFPPVIEHVEGIQ